MADTEIQATKIDGGAVIARLIDDSLKAGATAADARFARSEGLGAAVRGGALESVERDESVGVALRCFVGQRQAHVSGQDLSENGLGDLVERCVAMAKLAPEDQYAGLALPDELATEPADLDLTGDAAVTAEFLEAEALEAEAAALAIDGVKQVASCGAGTSFNERWVAASNGFAAHRASGSSSLGLAAVGERDGKMERDYESRQSRYRSDRPGPAEIGRIAGERTVARLGARRVASQKAAVIYDRRVASSLLSALIGAISGPAVARGVSFLKDRRGEMVFAPGINVIDDPFRARGLGSRAHDGEGRPVTRKAIIEDGRLTEFLLNGPSARQLGLTPNGFASTSFGDPPGVTTSNLHIEPGKMTPAEAMASVRQGLLVTDMFGPSINPNTGDYSVGVAGFWFEDGAVAFPVHEMTIAGELPAMFRRLKPLSDLEFRGATNAPSILIEDMSLAGT